MLSGPIWVTFGVQNGAKNDTKNGPEIGPDFGPETVPKQAPKMDPKMVPKRLLGEILVSSRLLGHQQAFFESSGSTMIASSFSRRLLGCFLGSFKALQGLHLELFGVFYSSSGAISGVFRLHPRPLLGHLDVLWGLLGPFFESTLALGRLSSV